MNSIKQSDEYELMPNLPKPARLPMKSILKLVIGSLAFFACFLMQMSGQFLQIQGIIAQVQVMISMYIVVSVVRTGYILAVLLNALECILVTIYVIQTNNFVVLTGAIVPLFSIVTMTIISFYGRRLHAKIKESLEREEQLTLLNKELSDTQEELRKLAYHDELTSLPNRKMIIQELNHLCDRYEYTNQSFAVVFMDLDNFKKVNDSFGHHIGDDLLITVGTYLRKTIHADDLVGRLGGDEFAFLLHQTRSDEELYVYMNALREGLLQEFPNELAEFGLSGSFGISIYPRDGRSTKELLKCADIAMYQAKQNGKNDVFLYQS